MTQKEAKQHWAKRINDFGTRTIKMGNAPATSLRIPMGGWSRESGFPHFTVPCPPGLVHKSLESHNKRGPHPERRLS